MACFGRAASGAMLVEHHLHRVRASILLLPARIKCPNLMYGGPEAPRLRMKNQTHHSCRSVWRATPRHATPRRAATRYRSFLPPKRVQQQPLARACLWCSRRKPSSKTRRRDPLPTARLTGRKNAEETPVRHSSKTKQCQTLRAFFSFPGT